MRVEAVLKSKPEAYDGKRVYYLGKGDPESWTRGTSSSGYPAKRAPFFVYIEAKSTHLSLSSLSDLRETTNYGSSHVQ